MVAGSLISRCGVIRGATSSPPDSRRWRAALRSGPGCTFPPRAAELGCRMLFVPHLFLALLCASMTLWPQAARAEVRRCVTSSGQTIFTDRKCEEVDAVERLPRTANPFGGALHRAGGCARTLQDLVFEMTTAIDGRDANRLATVYHWPGTSAGTGYQIWTRLDAIVNRPLVDIVPVIPASRPPPESPA